MSLAALPSRMLPEHQLARNMLLPKCSPSRCPRRLPHALHRLLSRAAPTLASRQQICSEGRKRSASDVCGWAAEHGSAAGAGVRGRCDC